jgi:hypothetical protein
MPESLAPTTNAATLTSHQPLSVSVEHAAAMIGISSRMLREMIRRGNVRVVRLGPRRIVVPIAELQRIVAA